MACDKMFQLKCSCYGWFTVCPSGCQDGLCNQDNGSCTCKQGLYGMHCDKTKPPGNRNC